MREGTGFSLSERPATGGDLAGQFRSALVSLPNNILLLDRAGTIVQVTSQLEERFGYPAGALVGQPVDTLLPEASRALPDTGGATFTSSGHDLLGRRRDGSQFPVEVIINALDPDTPGVLMASVFDRTERGENDRPRQMTVTDHCELERLIADLSARFINVPADGIDAVIRGALQRICETLDLDRATFFRILPDGERVEPVRWTGSAVSLTAPDPVSGAQRFPWTVGRLQSGQVVSFSSVEHLPNPTDREGYRVSGIRSAVTVPLSVAGRVVGAVSFKSFRRERVWHADELHMLQVFATAFGSVLVRRDSDDALHAAQAEVQRLRGLLHGENAHPQPREEARDSSGVGIIIGESASIRRVLDQAEQVASTDSTVLLLGETGTGKEVFASQIHESSTRRGRPMVRVNCAAIPETLMESELFGREKGAFTGALARQIGRFELANHSTIFLDEIGDLPMQVQVKLLRVLEERAIERLGSPTSIRIDVRIIAATHHDLEKRVAEGHFREDLYYRLNVFPIRVPPLRERVEDIPPLVWRFVEHFSRAFGKPIEGISAESLEALKRYAWPGNIRELRNVIERAMIVCTGARLNVPLPSGNAGAGGPPVARGDALEDVDRDHIRRTLEAAGWRVRGTGGAAERLKLKPSTLETRMAKLGIKRPAK